MKTIFCLLSTFLLIECSAQNCNEANSLLSVRKRKVGSTEYVIFTLMKPATSSVEVTDTQPQFIQDGSGQTVHVSGCKFKKITFKNMVWTCKTKIISGSTSLVKQVKNIGQLEGIISYIIGYSCNTKSIVNYDYDDGDKKKVVLRLRR